MANSVDPDQTYRSSLFWVHAVYFYTKFASNVRELFAADDFSKRHFQIHFFLGALRVNPYPANNNFPSALLYASAA